VAVVNPSLTDSTQVEVLAAVSVPGSVALDWTSRIRTSVRASRGTPTSTRWSAPRRASPPRSRATATGVTRPTSPSRRGPSFPVTYDITGNLVVTPANGGVSDSCPTGGGQTTVWTFASRC